MVKKARFNIMIILVGLLGFIAWLLLMYLVYIMRDFTDGFPPTGPDAWDKLFICFPLLYFLFYFYSGFSLRKRHTLVLSVTLHLAMLMYVLAFLIRDGLAALIIAIPFLGIAFLWSIMRRIEMRNIEN